MRGRRAGGTEGGGGRLRGLTPSRHGAPAPSRGPVPRVPRPPLETRAHPWRATPGVGAGLRHVPVKSLGALGGPSCPLCQAPESFILGRVFLLFLQVTRWHTAAVQQVFVDQVLVPVSGPLLAHTHPPPPPPPPLFLPIHAVLGSAQPSSRRGAELRTYSLRVSANSRGRWEAVAPSCSSWGSWRAEPAPLPQEEVGLALDRGLRPSSALRPAGCSPWPALLQAMAPKTPCRPLSRPWSAPGGCQPRGRALPPHLK